MAPLPKPGPFGRGAGRDDCSFKQSDLEGTAAKPGGDVSSRGVWVRPGEENNGAQGQRRTPTTPATHIPMGKPWSKEHHDPCLWGSVPGTSPSPQMFSHSAESHREGGELQPSVASLQAATWLSWGRVCRRGEQEARGRGTWPSLTSKQGTKKRLR